MRSSAPTRADVSAGATVAPRRRPQIVVDSGAREAHLTRSTATRGNAMTNYKLTISQLLADPAVSYWLKAAVEALMRRDPVDSVTDANHLANLMQERAKQHYKESMPYKSACRRLHERWAS